MDLNQAQQAIARGNLQLADMICRQHFEQSPEHPEAQQIWGQIQANIFSKPQRSATSQNRFLLIKAWGFGFWSDLDHVLGSLLLAELTDRRPMVYWGKNSLFRDDGIDNAFESFFEPVSPLTWDKLSADDASYFPAKWNAQNLRSDNINKWQGEGSRSSGLYALGRDETVVVSDFHTKIHDLIAWIPASSPWYGLDRVQIYRQLFKKYIHLKQHLANKVEQIWQTHMAGHQWLALHIRGTDKIQEVSNLDQVNQAYEKSIENVLKVNPNMKLFLMTDSAEILSAYRERWQDKLFFSDCQRGTGTQGVHLSGHSGTLMGEQVLTDAYLAARCDAFIGNGGSNVSTGIRHLKDWAPGTFFLFGQDFLGQIDPSLHVW